MLLFDPTMEGQDRSGILRHSMIRPGGVVVLGDHARVPRTSSKLEQTEEI